MEIRIGIANTGRELNFEYERARRRHQEVGRQRSGRRRDACELHRHQGQRATSSRPPPSPTSSWAPKSPAASASSPDATPSVQILLALIIGRRDRRRDPFPGREAAPRAASRSARSSAPLASGLVWMILTWAGVGLDSLWLVAVGVRRADRGDLPGPRHPRPHAHGPRRARARAPADRLRRRMPRPGPRWPERATPPAPSRPCGASERP